MPLESSLAAQNAANNTLRATLLMEELYRRGVQHVVLAPGSRNTSLTIAAARHPTLHTHVMHDERSAAYFALGIARALRKPAVVVTTSGTATANLYPAVIEADVDALPLLVVTADRPAEMVGTGANQTIDQVRLFGAHVRMNRDLAPPDEAVSAPQFLAIVDDVIDATLGSTPGPVHLNLRFRKALEPTELLALESIEGLSSWANANTPWRPWPATKWSAEPEALDALTSDVARAKRGLIVVGRLESSSDVASAQKIMALLGWPVWADPLSGVLGIQSGSLVASAMEASGAAPPDVVLHMGGPLVSVEVERFSNAASCKWHLAPRPMRIDPDGQQRKAVIGDFAFLAATLDAKLQAHLEQQEGTPGTKEHFVSSLSSEMKAIQSIVDEGIVSSLQSAGDMTQAYWMRQLTNALPENANLFVGNSSVIRDFERFSLDRKARRLFGQRGASGIDGNLSAAAGIARALGPTVAFLGDLTFLHDAGALSALAQEAIPLTVIVLDNRGGGIFEQLPVAQVIDVFERYFATPHDVDLVALGRAYGVQTEVLQAAVLQAEEVQATALPDSQETIEVGTRLRLLVVQTEREQSAAVVRDIRNVVTHLCQERST